MIQLLGSFPKQPFVVACSGGIDSMVMVDYLRKFPKYKFRLAYFNHGTEHGEEAELFLKSFSKTTGIPLECGRISGSKPKKKSPEEFWRDERYKFLDSLGSIVTTAHNLNDSVETWIFSCMRGHPKVIPYSRNNVIRPFLMVSRSTITKWCKKHNVEYIEDPSNADTRYSRNMIRLEVVPVVLKINAGLERTIRRRIASSYNVASLVNLESLSTSPSVQVGEG